MQEQKQYNWHLVILATSFSGASALVYEIIASRILLLFFGNALSSVTIVLMVFLGGLSLGAALMTVFRKKITNNASLFGIFQLIIAFYAIFILSQFIKLPQLFDALHNIISSDIALQLISAIIFILLPTILLGAIFPLAINMLGSNNTDGRIGWLYTLDVFGAVIGAAITGFFIIPNYGNTTTIVFAASLNILAALFVFSKKNKILYLILLLIFILSSYFIIQNKASYNISKDHQDSDVVSYEEKDILLFDKEDVLWQEASPWGIITILKEDSDIGQDRVMTIDDRKQCSLLDHESEQLIATAALRGIDNASVLSIGLGCGFTLSGILESNPKNVTVVEINPVVYQASKLFRDLTDNAIDDEKVNIVIQDGAEFLRTTDKKYDVIVIDIENPSVAHSSPLYTVEYLRYAKENLNENGKIALWAYHSSDYRYLKSLVETFKAVFNNVVFAEYNDPGYVYLFMASDGPLSVDVIDIKGNSQKLIENLDLLENVSPNTLDYNTLEKYYK